MMPLTICKTVLCLFVLIHHGACDAFVVVDIPPFQKALLTRLWNQNYWWETPRRSPRSTQTQHHHQHHQAAPPRPTYRQHQHQHHQAAAPPPAQQQRQQTSLREQQLELQIQQLQAQLGRMTAKQENMEVFLTLLDVSDNLARALDAVPAQEKESNDALKALCEGVAMTEKGLDKVLEMSGIVKYGNVGEPFDHNVHHAVCEYPDPEKETDTVGHIIKAGYFHNDSVLRCAQVAVVKRHPRPDESCDLGEY